MRKNTTTNKSSLTLPARHLRNSSFGHHTYGFFSMVLQRHFKLEIIVLDVFESKFIVHLFGAFYFIFLSCK